MLTPDYTVTQTLDTVEFTIHLPSKKPSDIDVIIADNTVKVTAQPYLLFLDLPQAICLSKSSSSKKLFSVDLILVKQTQGFWEDVTLSNLTKKERELRRNEAFERYYKHIQEQEKLQLEQQTSLSRHQLKNQWEIQKQERNLVDKLQSEHHAIVSEKIDKVNESQAIYDPITPPPDPTPIRPSLSISINLTPSGALCSRSDRPETLFPPSQSFESEVDGLIIRSENLLIGGDTVSAFNVISTALSKFPFNISALNQRSKVSESQGNYSQCLADILIALSNVEKMEREISQKERLIVGELYHRQSRVYNCQSNYFDCWQSFLTGLSHFDQSRLVSDDVMAQKRQEYQQLSFDCSSKLFSEGQSFLIAKQFSKSFNCFQKSRDIAQKGGSERCNLIGINSWLNLSLVALKMIDLELSFSILTEFKSSKLFNFLDEVHLKVFTSRLELVGTLLCR
ncbi:hypothetical protein RCL1_004854 [Eukaryota sp. TZLM3-RCL]